MKITEMLDREDFYAINEATLAKFYDGSCGESELFVYPRLNTIVAKHPSDAVRAYICDEYNLRGNPMKRVAAQSYVRLCLASKGILASKRIRVPSETGNDVLIYPCNKKYRIFDFKNGFVDVIGKAGFDDGDLRHEIAFRTKSGLPDFVPPLYYFDDRTYREKIIRGRSLARCSKGFDSLRDAAYHSLCAFRKPTEYTVGGAEYAKRLSAAIDATAAKAEDPKLLCDVRESLAQRVSEEEGISLAFSHGDLQAGNIWVEEGTDRIYIIDWESWGERSVYYDKAVLYDHLRPGSIMDYLKNDTSAGEKAVVLMEDLLYHLESLNALPADFGVQEFGGYLETLASYV